MIIGPGIWPLSGKAAGRLCAGRISTHTKYGSLKRLSKTLAGHNLPIKLTGPASRLFETKGRCSRPVNLSWSFGGAGGQKRIEYVIPEVDERTGFGPTLSWRGGVRVMRIAPLAD